MARHIVGRAAIARGHRKFNQANDCVPVPRRIGSGVGDGGW
jgi:hypothetical protein